MKLAELVAVPLTVVSEIGPLFAHFGTVTEISESETTVNHALELPISTLVAPERFVPLTFQSMPGHRSSA